LTCLPAFELYFRPELFFEEDFFEDLFFDEDFFEDDFFAEVRFDEDFFAGALRLLRFLLEDFFADDFRPDFLLAFFVAMGETSRKVGAFVHQLRCIGESKMRTILRCDSECTAPLVQTTAKRECNHCGGTSEGNGRDCRIENMIMAVAQRAKFVPPGSSRVSGNTCRRCARTAC
jgi:hypothetical protein